MLKKDYTPEQIMGMQWEPGIIFPPKYFGLIRNLKTSLIHSISASPLVGFEPTTHGLEVLLSEVVEIFAEDEQFEH